ncbi:MAG: hypothetical protein GF309_03675 [Candidatus Lokiarchaeota archaeon]|nr:hypothetical protein [Candidatus Lokiarchaeota archaeon]
MKCRKEGKYENYQKSLYESSPRWRGMQRMQEKVEALGPARYVIGIFVILGIILLFVTARQLPFW